jgi:hypothetical protein
VDFGVTKYINNISVKWETAGAYTIQTSNDDITYTTIKSASAVSNSTSNDTLATQARYVKISASSYRSIWTFAVNGSN